jgi:hypothetical protein
LKVRIEQLEQAAAQQASQPAPVSAAPVTAAPVTGRRAPESTLNDDQYVNLTYWHRQYEGPVIDTIMASGKMPGIGKRCKRAALTGGQQEREGAHNSVYRVGLLRAYARWLSDPAVDRTDFDDWVAYYQTSRYTKPQAPSAS